MNFGRGEALLCYECEYLDKNKKICKKTNKPIYENFYSKVHKKSVKIYKIPEKCKFFKRFDYKKFYELLERVRKNA
jgi:hypothetical protein